MKSLNNDVAASARSNQPLSLVKLDSWVRDLIVDPIGKSPLNFDQQRICSDYGVFYPIVGSIIDFRPFKNVRVSRDSLVWKLGQDFYETWSNRQLFKNGISYESELAGVREVYQTMPIQGRCLDVGGHEGRLRAFLKPGQEYVIIDPFLETFKTIPANKDLLKTYPFLLEPVNFICGMAEYLPFKSNSFDTVHMRSVIDHFQNPELAVCEAYRVLRPGGQLIVGIYVEGGRSGRLSFKERVKEVLSHTLPLVGISKFVDHHVWHPTFNELCALIEGTGFNIDKVHWQSDWGDRVCYIKSIKAPSS